MNIVQFMRLVEANAVLALLFRLKIGYSTIVALPNRIETASNQFNLERINLCKAQHTQNLSMFLASSCSRVV